jgi:prevent-host-death family protein
LTIWSFYDHILVMKSVSVAELKSKLSQYLAAVKNGKEIVITSHRHSIARIVPMEKRGTDLRIIPARKPVSTLRHLTGVKLKIDLVADLLADRRRR